MNIEIRQPELEAIIQQRMATGRFRDVEDVLLHALKGTEIGPSPAAREPAMGLNAVFAKAREILGGEELIIERDSSSGHPVDLS